MDLFGGTAADWLDLSTGINPDPYPVPDIPADAWMVLPRKRDQARLADAAAQAYGSTARVIALNGAQGAIQLVPMLRAPGRAAVLCPTYNEHAAALRANGWPITEVTSLEDLAGADLAVVVNPNNPDGQRFDPDALRAMAERVGILIVDESFADPEPDLSCAPHDPPDNMVILRSFGKFYGLAGLRLGFALAKGALADRLADLAGPWPVSGPAIEIATTALSDLRWQTEATKTLNKGVARLDALAASVGWTLVGGTPLFRTYDTGHAEVVQHHLAAQHCWSRIFPYSDGWLRLGLPPAARWHQLEAAFGAIKASARG